MTRREVKNLGFQEFVSVEQFCRHWDSSFNGAIAIEDKLPIHLHWTNKNAANTVICFSAASMKVREVPFWTGRGLTPSVDANFLLVSDPTMILDRTLNLGWYAGSREQPDLIETLTEIFRAVTSGTRPIFFGASGGGWAALKYAARLDGAAAVVVNPQVDIARYKYFSPYLRKAWNTEKGSEQLPFEGNVARDYSQGNDATVVYVQNSRDFHHRDEHFELFKSECGTPEKLIDLLPDLGPGHIAPARESLVDILKEVVSTRSISELRTNLSSLPIKSSGINKEIQVKASSTFSAEVVDKRYPVLFDETYQISSSTGACSVELTSTANLPAKAFVLEVHLDGAVMDKKLAKQMSLSWSDGLRSAFFYSQPVAENLWSQHQDFLIPKSATGVRVVVRKWSRDGTVEAPTVKLRLCSKTDASKLSF